MKRLILILTSTLTLLGCEYSYDISHNFTEPFSPKVIVNSLLNPDTTIRVDVLWSKEYTKPEVTTGDISHYRDGYEVVRAFKVRLLEDGTEIFNDSCYYGLLELNRKPLEGSEYRIEIEIDGYDQGVVSAETYIPHRPKSCSVKSKGYNSAGYYYRYDLFAIESIAAAEATRSIILRNYSLYTTLKDSTKLCDFYNTVNANLDQVNATTDTSEEAEKQSNITHLFFMRIPYENLEAAMPINYSTKGHGNLNERVIIGESEFGYPIYKDVAHGATHAIVEAIAPSDDYDRYNKTLYEYNMSFTSMSFSTPISVYSNIENGLGLFAGYSSLKEIVKLEGGGVVNE